MTVRTRLLLHSVFKHAAASFGFTAVAVIIMWLVFISAQRQTCT